MAQRTDLQRRELPELNLTLTDFIPKPTPRNVTFGGLWMLGLSFMFLLPALMPASTQSMDLYDAKMMQAQSIDLNDVEENYMRARQSYEQSRGWFFQAQSQRNQAAQQALDRARREMDVLLDKRAAIQKEGKHAVGVWSEYGMEETRDAFWQSFNSGVGFAKSVTKNQAFYSLIFGGMGMRRDEGMASFVLRWVGKILMNFTIGLCGACISFIWSLWGIVNTYAPSFFSALSFFLLGSLGALSVTITIVGGIWGTAGAGVYFAAKGAINQMRLQQEQRQRYIEQHGHPPPQRQRQPRRQQYGQRPHYQ